MYAMTCFLLDDLDALRRGKIPDIRDLRENYQLEFAQNNTLDMASLNLFFERYTRHKMIESDERYHSERFPQEFDRNYISQKTLNATSDPNKRTKKTTWSDPTKKTSSERQRVFESLKKLKETMKKKETKPTEDSVVRYPNTRSRVKGRTTENPPLMQMLLLLQKKA